MNIPSIHKFSFVEACSDSTGKTCMSLICGFMMILTGCIMGIKAAWTSDANIALQSVAFIMGGSTLLGVRRFTKDEELKPPQINEEAK